MTLNISVDQDVTYYVLLENVFQLLLVREVELKPREGVDRVEYVENASNFLDTEHVEYIKYSESIVNMLKMMSSTICRAFLTLRSMLKKAKLYLQ